MTIWKPAVIIAAVALGVGTIFASGDLQQVILMAAAVTAALVCFDSALNRRNRSFLPWLLLCIAVLAKAIPSVLYGLSPDTLSFERWDHLGTVASAFFVMLALIAAAVSLAPLSTADRTRIFALTALGALAAGAAGAALGYAYDAGFGSETTARIYETLGWAFAGGALVAGLVAVGRSSRPTPALAGVAVFGALTVVLTAWASAGRSISVGWWALSWAVLAVAALAFSGARLTGPSKASSRMFQALAGVGALAALVAAISTFVFSSTWSLGWIVLLLAAIGFAGLAFTQPSTPEEAHQAATDQAFVGAIEAERSGPLGDLLTVPDEPLGVRAAASAELPEQPLFPVTASAEVAGREVSVAQTESAQRESAQAESAPSQAFAQTTSAVDQVDVPAPPPAAPAQPVIPASPPAPVAEPAVRAPQMPSYTNSGTPRRMSAADLTDALAPRHYDPPTMLLSNAGLQESVLRAFAQPARAEHETALLFVALRNAEEIEEEHGRVVVDDVIRHLANRLRSGLPDAVCSRFAPAAFAALLVGQTPPNDQVIERSTRTLLDMLNDITSDGAVVRVDVVGGLAQCYEDETADSLVSRANEGLERAVASPEPTLVAMP